MALNCPNCGSERTTSHSDRSREVRVARRRKLVHGLCYSVCQKCKEHFSTDAQHDHNIDLLAKAEAELTPLAPKQIRAVRSTLALTQEEAQRLFAGGRNAFSKYERGQVVPTEASAKLMRASLVVPGLIHHLAQEASIPSRSEWDHLLPRPNYQSVSATRMFSGASMKDDLFEQSFVRRDFVLMAALFGQNVEEMPLAVYGGVPVEGFGLPSFEYPRVAKQATSS